MAKRCNHRCGDKTVRYMDHQFNQRVWWDWVTGHGLPIPQVVLAGGFVVRNVADKQVIALVYDWNPGDEISYDVNGPCHLYREGGIVGNPRTKALVVQLDREPDPFPTGFDCPIEWTFDEDLNPTIPVMSQEEQDAEWLGMTHEQRLSEALMLISIVEASPDGGPVPVDDRLEGGLMVNQCDEKKRARAARMVASRDREVEARLKARGDDGGDT